LNVAHSGNQCSGLCNQAGAVPPGCGHIGCWQCGQPSHADVDAAEELTGVPYVQKDPDDGWPRPWDPKMRDTMSRARRVELQLQGVTEEDIAAAEELLGRHLQEYTFETAAVAHDDVIADLTHLQAQVNAKIISVAEAHKTLVLTRHTTLLYSRKQLTPSGRGTCDRLPPPLARCLYRSGAQTPPGQGGTS